jgi:transmembrane sensor
MPTLSLCLTWKDAVLPEFDEDRVLEEAAVWWQRLQSSEPYDQATFNEWINADNSHKEAFDAMSQAWGLFDTVQSTPELLAYRADALSKAQKLGQQRWKLNRPMNRRALAAGIAAAAVVPVAGFFALNRAEAQDIQTHTGEQKTVRLSDGSDVYVDANTHLTVELSRGRRRILLKAGRSHFQVAKDSARPFIVEIDGTTVTATGTAFSVERRDDSVSVVLVEGAVRVKTATYETMMQPQDRLQLPSGGAPQLARSVDLEKAMSWRFGKLVFENARLADAVARMNDYATVQIAIDDADVANLRISGVFTAGKSRPFVRAVTAYLPVSAREEGDTIALEAKETE